MIPTRCTAAVDATVRRGCIDYTKLVGPPAPLGNAATLWCHPPRRSQRGRREFGSIERAV